MLKVQGPADTDDRARLLALSDERDHWLARVLASWRAGYRHGYGDGWRAGRESAHREMSDAWAAVARGVGAGGQIADRRRWRLRGQQRARETFGQAHPADYPGRGAA